jgi:hypothetical protein
VLNGSRKAKMRLMLGAPGGEISVEDGANSRNSRDAKKGYCTQ